MHRLAKLIFLLICFASIYSAKIYALPFIMVPKSGTTLPTLSFPNTVIPAYYIVINNTSKVLANNFVKFLPTNVTQNINDTAYPNVCGLTFTLQPKGSAGDRCTLALSVEGPVNASDPSPRRHLFVCMQNGALCAGTNSPLDVRAAGNQYLFNIYYYLFPIAQSLLPPGQNPFFGPFTNDVTLKRCDMPSDIFIDSSNPNGHANSINCRWGDYNAGSNAGKSNMEIVVHVTRDIKSVRATCTFTPQSTSKITFVMTAKSGSLPFQDPRPGQSGFFDLPSILPIASLLPGLLPAPNPTIVNTSSGIQQIEVTFPNYNTFVNTVGPILQPTSQIDTIFIINNNSGVFQLDDTIFCTFTPQFVP